MNSRYGIKGMKNSQLVKYYEIRVESFHKYFERTLNGGRKEDLHELRVIIKKLKAMWSLMHYSSQGQWKKKPHTELITKLFTETGKLRDAQVNLDLLGPYYGKFLLPFYEFTEKNIKRMQKKLHQTMMFFDIESFDILNNDLKKFIRSSNDGLVEECSRYASKKVKKMKKDLPEKGRLHRLRIQLQALVEMYKIIIAIDGQTISATRNENLKTLSRQMGKWHDYHQLMNSLHDFIQTNPDGKNKRPLNNLIKKIKKQQELRLHKIQKLLERYLLRLS